MPQTLDVPFDPDVLLVTGMSSKDFIDATRFTMAAKLWMDGKLTAGQAAKVCGMEKAAFLNELPKQGYPMTNIGVDDLDDDIVFAKRKTGCK